MSPGSSPPTWWHSPPGDPFSVRAGAEDRQHQLDRYDEEIIPHFKLTNVAASRKSRGLFYVRRSRHLEGVAVWIGQNIVLLPPDGRDMTFYGRLAPLIGGAENISLQGDEYHWRSEPKYTVDSGDDSLLVLPTRGNLGTSWEQ